MRVGARCARARAPAHVALFFFGGAPSPAPPRLRKAELLAASAAERGGSRLCRVAPGRPACVRGRLARRARDSVPTLDARPPLPSHPPSLPLLSSIPPAPPPSSSAAAAACALLLRKGGTSNRSWVLREGQDTRHALFSELGGGGGERTAYLPACEPRHRAPRIPLPSALARCSRLAPPPHTHNPPATPPAAQQ